MKRSSEDRDHLASTGYGREPATPGRAQRLDEHAGQAVQADELDELADLGLRAAHAQLGAAASAGAARASRGRA